LAGDEGFVDESGGRELLGTLALMLGARGGRDEAARALDVLASSPLATEGRLDEALGLALALGDGLRRSGAGLFAAGSGPGAELLERLAAYAESTVADPSAEPEARARASALFGYRPFEEAKEVLSSRLSPDEPREVQLAAARALARHGEA